jgi:hypothetical protein
METHTSCWVLRLTLSTMGTNTHASGEGEGHHASSCERIMFASLIFASLLVL